MTFGSVVIRRSLGRRLKALRVDAGKSSADVAEAGIASKSKLARIEAGAGPVRMADVRALCWLYQADTALTETLAQQALNTLGDAWWEDYADAVPSWFSLYMELESAASRICTYDPELVHGLLQTAKYQEAVFSTFPGLTREHAARQISLRVGRQQAAFGRVGPAIAPTGPTGPVPPLKVYAVMSAGVLQREVGSAEVMAEQRQQLAEMDRSNHIDVRVLPWKAGAHVAMKGSFTILDFEDPEDPSVVYLETHAGGRYMEKSRVVTGYREMFDMITKQSIPIGEHQ